MVYINRAAVSSCALGSLDFRGRGPRDLPVRGPCGLRRGPCVRDSRGFCARRGPRGPCGRGPCVRGPCVRGPCVRGPRVRRRCRYPVHGGCPGRRGDSEHLNTVPPEPLTRKVI